ncbi:MAG: hypothetical protein ACOH1N_14215 [Lutibacter sp.]
MNTDKEMLISIRKALGLEWKEFANNLGYNNVYSYKNIENGVAPVGPLLRRRLEQIFKVNPDYMEKREGEMFYESWVPGEVLKRESKETEENKSEKDDIIKKLNESLVLLQETINKQVQMSITQAETIRNLELRNGRITDQLIDSMLRNTEHESKKEEYPIKKSG